MECEGVCRCCAADGPSKYLDSSYLWMGETEVYSEMLKACFDITLKAAENGKNGGICSICITQLRNAYNFKKQVLFTEEQFHRKLEDENSQVNIKLEVDPEDDGSSDHHADDDDDDDIKEYEVNIKDESAEEKAKPKRPARQSALKTKRAKIEKAETSSSAVDGKRKRKKRKRPNESATPERLEHRVNLTTILQHSNASPFRDKTANGFSCLYCAQHFKNIDDLRQHTAQKSEKDKINTIIDYKLSYHPIKVDITNLHCLLCNTPMTDLNHLKDHLVNTHKKVIHKNIKDIILPFRLYDGNSFNCVICSDVHISFKNLYHHMSQHYRNYCCDKCGVGYITIAALRKHHKTHERGNFKCQYCEKTYSSLSKKKSHEKGVHLGGWLRNKCPHCPEIFVSYYDRGEHLVKVHNAAPVVYPCNACSKVYKKKFELSRHIKHHHLQQKNYTCDTCKARFYSKRGLIEHMSRHMDGEFHSCDLCGKSFSRPRSLKEHMKFHEDDKKHQCELCKKTFVQKFALKNHLRVHQDDLDIFKEFDDVKHLIDNRDLTLKQVGEEYRKKEAEEKAATSTM